MHRGNRRGSLPESAPAVPCEANRPLLPCRSPSAHPLPAPHNLRTIVVNNPRRDERRLLRYTEVNFLASSRLVGQAITSAEREGCCRSPPMRASRRTRCGEGGTRTYEITQS